MFDFHTHILPEIDDGSQSVSESLHLIEELKRQGVTGIAATPHFYPQYISPERFFEKRHLAWEKLQTELEQDAPEIRLGAEVNYFEGIHRFLDLKEFCIEGTDLLLLEMPMCIWSSRMISSVLETGKREGITVVLAHIERYLPFHGNKEAMDILSQNGILFQVNTGLFLENKFLAKRLLHSGRVQLLGTDTHNMTNRKPNYWAAMEIISKKKEKKWMSALEKREKILLNDEGCNSIMMDESERERQDKIIDNAKRRQFSLGFWWKRNN